ncbi:hypothetical protein OK015_18060 [Mycobacterium sp. Aquia_216]|uniref:hypothetical protein n=1 Tax=Mycobacterium sp. Aquia_216 TaxID=2991729 RepID=UPI00227C9600|nr:hypothetical protein [Mycobacterium sp. Aquia_216]WAJ43125.1 hypothetical protein OK015_18060 [Mycobacterium sp. Aquia_216]
MANPPPGLPPGAQLLPATAIEGKVPGIVADVFSIQRDLDFARQCAAGYLQRTAFDDDGQPLQQTEEPDRTLLAEALWSAAVIAYRRAFATGKAHIVPKEQRFDIKGLRAHVFTPEQTELDDQLRGMADQHVAHRVSDLEQMKFQVTLTPPPHPRAVAALGPWMLHMIGPTTDVAEGMIGICDVLLPILAQEMQPFYNAMAQKLSDPEQLDRLYANAGYPGQNSAAGTDSA